MKLVLKIFGIILGLLILVIAGAYIHLEMTWKQDHSAFPAPDIEAVQDSATIARGEYLVHALVHCSACHQTGADLSKRKGTDLNLEMAGGHVWDIQPFGKFVAANLTSDGETGIGKVSDAVLARAIRNGVNRHGEIAPFMSFAVGPMADEDLVAVISYLRTLQPVKNAVPAEEMGVLGKFVGKKLNPAKDPPPKWVPEGDSADVARGEYLANGPAYCFGCHSVSDPMSGFAIVGPRFQGAGQADPDPLDAGFEIQAPNLTPDAETGHIAKWGEEDFVKRFRAGVNFPGSPMPWENYARMTDADIRSIYRYLKTLAPVKHGTGPARRAKGSFKKKEA